MTGAAFRASAGSSQSHRSLGQLGGVKPHWVTHHTSVTGAETQILSFHFVRAPDHREKEATRAIERIVANYQCTKKAVRKALGDRERVKVLVSSYSSWGAGGWSVPAEGVYYDEMVTAAGGKLIGTDPDKYSYTNEEIKKIAKDADVWLSFGEWKRSEEHTSELQSP